MDESPQEERNQFKTFGRIISYFDGKLTFLEINQRTIKENIKLKHIMIDRVSIKAASVMYVLSIKPVICLSYQ